MSQNLIRQPTEEHSPIRTQYLSIKQQYPDALIFFRLGDFYETFDTDAEIVARELEITLTKREWGRGERSPMAGVPHHAADAYIARLIARGYRVAVVEQITEPTGKGIVQRDVARIVTPGTVVEPSMLAARKNTYLAAVAIGRDIVGIAYADISTGEFCCTQISTSDPALVLAQEMARIAPAEVLIEQPVQARLDPRALRAAAAEQDIDEQDPFELPEWTHAMMPFVGHITPADPRNFVERAARDRLLEIFHVITLEGFGCEKLPYAIRAAGAIAAYLHVTQRGALDHLTALQTYSIEQFMVLDPYTRRNLELFESERDRSSRSTLFWVIDHTHTPMGSRLLRRWLGQPLLDIPTINARYDAIDILKQTPMQRAHLVARLDHIGDIERLANRLSQRIATPRDLAALADGLRIIQAMAIDPALVDLFVDSVQIVTGSLDACADIADRISTALVDTPPIILSDGGIIRSGYSTELDDIGEKSRHAREWIASLEAKERARTGIANLKVGFNKVFGYYIELSNSFTNRAPPEYIRKQTVTTGERYITPDLKEYESLVLNAQERSAKLEYELFTALRNELAAQSAARVIDTARTIATLDVIQALADVAEEYGYVRPILNDSHRLHITAGRHPVIERAQSDIPFVPNTVTLDSDDVQIMLITGPNMSGKSTIMRQTALLILLAQIGSFVPADRAEIGIVDRIFTRIGAQDDLATGQSTFMVEMVETANILRHATRASFVVLDEIGRGTSTYDGLAIARSIVEYLHDNPRCGARTMFATHYHELIEGTQSLAHVKPYTIAVTEEHGHVVFLRTLIEGGTDRSYGIHVAQLAGIPAPVVKRAREILSHLEQKGDGGHRKHAMRTMEMPATLQLSLFTPPPAHDPILDELREMRLDELSPREALQMLYRLQSAVQQRDK